jgi:valyl-tRNA synthetase
MSRELYDFAWDEFCSFYIEISKSRLNHATMKKQAQHCLAYVLSSLIRLLHPIMPFETEEIWQHLREFDDTLAESVTIAPWPECDTTAINPEIEMQFGRFQDVLRAVREVRSRQNVPPKTEMRFVVKCDPQLAVLLEPMTPYFRSMAGAIAQGWGQEVSVPKLSSSVAITGAEIIVDLAGLIDVAAELAKKTKDIQKLEGLIKGKEAKLANAAFVSKAPPEVLEKERESLADLKNQLTAAQEACRLLEQQG